MALFDKDKNIFIGIGVGLVAAGIVKGLLPAFGGLGRPIAKGLIRGGILAYEVGRESVAQAAEYVEDLVAEVRSEMDGGEEQAAAQVSEPQPEGGPVQ